MIFGRVFQKSRLVFEGIVLVLCIGCQWEVRHISLHAIDGGRGIVDAFGSKPLHVLINLCRQSTEFIHAHGLPDGATLSMD